MPRNRLLLAVVFALLSFITTSRGQDAKPATWKGTGMKGAVATGGADAAKAGLALLQAGGNASDGAAAAILAMCVTDFPIVVFGGEVPILVYDAKRKVVEVLSGMGTAPRLATRAHFAKKGIPSKGSAESAAVPATFDACITLLDRYGTKTFAEVAAPTLQMLDRKEKSWHTDLARTIRRLIDAEAQSPHDRRRGLRLAADYFYRGPIAHEIDTWSRANGALLRYSDLATHVTRVEEPAQADYRGYTVLKCGFWTQGPSLLQSLQLLEGYDLKKMGHNQPDTIHVMAEALKLALADRDKYYADPLFAKVPGAELLSPKYAEVRRSLIDMKSASQTQQPGDPLGVKALLEDPMMATGDGAVDRDTSTCVVADSMGNLVVATPSGFNGVLAGSTGVWLGSRLQSFNTWEGHPNCIEPGKRPRITLTPGMVLKDGKPLLGVSVAGGDGQDQVALQILVNALDFGMLPADAVTQPRFGTKHHLGSFLQSPPLLGSLSINAAVGEATIKNLQQRGHKISRSDDSGVRPVLVHIDPRTGLLSIAGDPRGKRNALAY